MLRLIKTNFHLEHNWSVFFWWLGSQFLFHSDNYCKHFWELLQCFLWNATVTQFQSSHHLALWTECEIIELWLSQKACSLVMRGQILNTDWESPQRAIKRHFKSPLEKQATGRGADCENQAHLLVYVGFAVRQSLLHQDSSRFSKRFLFLAPFTECISMQLD